MLFNFEKVRDYYQVCVISCYEKIQFLSGIFNQIDVIDTFFSGIAVTLQAFFQKYHIEHAKESTSIIASQKSTKKFFDFCERL